MRRKKIENFLIKFYLIDGVGLGLVVVLGDLKAIQNGAVRANGRNFNGVMRREERGSPVVDETFVHDHKPFHVIKL